MEQKDDELRRQKKKIAAIKMDAIRYHAKYQEMKK